jgi:hypothetical protein
MKKLLISFALFAVSFAANCQTKEDVKAMIAGYKLFDTIQVDDFMKLSEVISNDKAFTIVSFTMSYDDSGYNVSHESTSNMITDEMKKNLLNIKDKQHKIHKLYIEKIKAKNQSGKIVDVPPLIFSLRIK